MARASAGSKTLGHGRAKGVELDSSTRARRCNSTCVQLEERSVKLDRLAQKHDKNSARVTTSAIAFPLPVADQKL